MRILLIDNTLDPQSRGSLEIREMLQSFDFPTLMTRRAPEFDLPKSSREPDVVILSGSRADAHDQSPWVLKLDEWLNPRLSEGLPTFGICFGHQTLARILGGIQSVGRAKEAEIGWGEIQLTEAGKKSSLFSGQKERFHSFQSHQDEVYTLPKSAIHLAFSSRCQHQAFQVGNRPIFGIQFHPERNLVRAQLTFERRRKSSNPLPLLNEKRGPELYDPTLGRRIFENFFSLLKTK